MTAPYGLPSNYTSNPMYMQYMLMMMQNAQQQAQQQQAIAQQKQALFAQAQAQKEAEALAAQQAQTQQSAMINPQTIQQPADASSIKTDIKGDGKDDGKISFGSKLKNFGKGIGKFFTGMVCDENGKFSLKRTLTTVAVGAGAIALTIATGGAATPFLIAAGAALGTVQVGKGAYKAIVSKTDAEAEQAWQDIGGGTTAIVGSLAGAKGALKTAGKIPAPASSSSTTSVVLHSGTTTNAGTAAAAAKTGRLANAWNAAKDSFGATKECFKITGKGSWEGLKGLAHPFKSYRSVSAYYKNTMKPNLNQAFSYKTGHKNYNTEMEAKLNKNIKNIDKEIKTLKDELAAGPKHERIVEIDKKLYQLEQQKSNEAIKLGFLDGKNKATSIVNENIKAIETKISDPATTPTERLNLLSQKNNLLKLSEMANKHYNVHAKKYVKTLEEKLANMKEDLKTATGDKKTDLEINIKLGEKFLGDLKAQNKIEFAQNNILKAEEQIAKLNSELKTAGLTDARKEVIQANIEKLQGVIKSDKAILRNANAKIAVKQNLPKVALPYGTYHLANQSQKQGTPILSQEDAYAQANGFQSAEQMMQYLQTMQDSEAALANADKVLAQTNQYTQQNNNQNNPYATSIFPTMQPPVENGLGFNDFYVSPYPEMI